MAVQEALVVAATQDSYKRRTVYLACEKSASVAKLMHGSPI